MYRILAWPAAESNLTLAPRTLNPTPKPAFTAYLKALTSGSPAAGAVVPGIGGVLADWVAASLPQPARLTVWNQ
jgi:hypothetical protein